MKKLLTLASLMFLLGGCTSKLKVKVSVLKSSYLTDNKEVLEARVNLFRKKYIASNKFNDLKSQLLLDLDKILIELEENKIIDENDKNTIQNKGKKAIEDKIQAAQTQYDLAIEELAAIMPLSRPVKQLDPKTSIVELSPKSDVTKLKEVLLKFESGDVELNKIIGEVDKVIVELNRIVTAAAKKATAEMVSLQKTQNDVRKTINTVVLAPLFDDPMTSIVVNGDKEFWKGKTNEAKARSFIGNSDIAIVMESPGEYSIKGIRNDASQATKALFTVTNLTVQTLAKAYGVGLAPTPITDSSTYYAQIQVARVDLEKVEKFSQKALTDIFQAILNEESNITSDTSRIRRSINKIDVLVKNKQSQLNK